MNATAAATESGASPFDILDEVNASSGPSAVIDALISCLESNFVGRPLLDALLLKARYDLGLPLIQVGPLSELPEPLRNGYQER